MFSDKTMSAFSGDKLAKKMQQQIVIKGCRGQSVVLLSLWILTAN